MACGNSGSLFGGWGWAGNPLSDFVLSRVTHRFHSACGQRQSRSPSPPPGAREAQSCLGLEGRKPEMLETVSNDCPAPTRWSRQTLHGPPESLSSACLFLALSVPLGLHSWARCLNLFSHDLSPFLHFPSFPQSSGLPSLPPFGDTARTVSCVLSWSLSSVASLGLKGIGITG